MLGRRVWQRRGSSHFTYGLYISLFVQGGVDFERAAPQARRPESG
jgi:hypothetical protein